MNQIPIFLSGLPRSGSTLISSLLNQHPDIYASTTSHIFNVVNTVYNAFESKMETIVEKSEQQKKNVTNSVFKNSYYHIDKTFVVDKNRIWPSQIKFIKETFNFEPKIICCVRDISEILASFVTLCEKNKDDNFVDNILKKNNFVVNNTNRCRFLWKHGVVGESWKAFFSGYNTNKKNLLIIEYNDILKNPKNIMKSIEKFIGAKHYKYNTNNLIPMKEHDKFHGMEGLHDIEITGIKRLSKPAYEIIGVGNYNYYNNMELHFWREGKKYEKSLYN